MTATVTPLRRTTQPHDPALLATLAELSQLGLAVARVAARLATVEDAALDALAAAASTGALAAPASLGDARQAGQDADASEAARNAAVARVAVITECFSKAARAVRRTVALQARLASGRSFPEIAPTPPAQQHHPAPQTHAAPRARSDADHPDRPELGDELGARTDEDVLHDIRRDLSAAAHNLARDPRRVGVNPPPRAPAPAPPPDHNPGATPPLAPDT